MVPHEVFLREFDHRDRIFWDQRIIAYVVPFVNNLNSFWSCKWLGIQSTFIFGGWQICWPKYGHLNTWMTMHSTNVLILPSIAIGAFEMLAAWVFTLSSEKSMSDRCLDSALNCMQSRPRVGWAAVNRSHQGGVLSWNMLSGYCNSIHWNAWLLHVAFRFPWMACSLGVSDVSYSYLHLADILRIGQFDTSKAGGECTHLTRFWNPSIVTWQVSFSNEL